MIEREGAIKIYNEVLGAKGAKGRLVRVAEGFYEVLVDIGGKPFTGLLPIASTVILSAEPEEEISSLDVER
jgi:hypothetical protein